MEIPSVPGATQPTVAIAIVALDTALGQRPALVWTGVVQCTDLAIVKSQRNALGTGLHRAHLAFAQLIRLGDLVPGGAQAILGVELILRHLLVRTIAQRGLAVRLHWQKK